jgi:hypothetical protein
MTSPTYAHNGKHAGREGKGEGPMMNVLGRCSSAI